MSPSVPRSCLGAALAIALLTGCPAGDPRYEEAMLGAAVQAICPGDPSGICDFSEDVELRVGFGAVDITPTRYETWIDHNENGEWNSGVDEYLDCGMDRLCPGDDGYVAPDDGEGDEEFQALWMAGFGQGRAMAGVADGLWARGAWLEQGETSIGIVSIDVVGFFYNEVTELRAALQQSLELDHLVVASTHNHEAPDTMGQWGQNVARSGVNAEFMEQIHRGITDAMTAAKASAVAADVRGGSYSIGHDEWEGTGVNNINLDTRDPNITDETIWTVRFTEAGTDTTIGSWINFPNHPEAASSDNLLLTSDFAHSLRETVEQGAAEGPAGPLDGVGGVAIYFQGACGGLQTPLRINVIDLDGTLYDHSGIPKAYATGRVTGYHALQAMATDEAAVEPTLSFRSRDFFVPVENRIFQLAMNLNLFDRPGYHYYEDEIIDEGNQPDLLTEVSVLQIGDVSITTIPGEITPELAIGGYDGAHTGPNKPIIDEGNSNPPDLSLAPAGPYINDRLPGQHKLLLGLGNDEIGYIVPDYNYQLDPDDPWFDEAPGDHYEETNSVGPRVRELVETTLVALIEWEPPQD
jgi:hypothetical protein